MTNNWVDRPVGIVGLGCIGGSLGLDLRKQGIEVRGLVRRTDIAERALERGLASRVDTDPSVLKHCRMIVLALPIDQLLNPPKELLAALPTKATITDVGSVKTPVLERWNKLHSRYIPSHPMAGTERAGIEAGIRGLFNDRAWVVTPTTETNPQALEEVHQLSKLVKARWICCDPHEHDKAVAMISHMPVLASAALLETAECGAGKGTIELARILASSGFSDTSRIGGGNPKLGVQMARQNQEEVLAALRIYKQKVNELEEYVEEKRWEELEQRLTRCRYIRKRFTDSGMPDQPMDEQHTEDS